MYEQELTYWSLWLDDATIRMRDSQEKALALNGSHFSKSGGLGGSACVVAIVNLVFDQVDSLVEETFANLQARSATLMSYEYAERHLLDVLAQEFDALSKKVPTSALIFGLLNTPFQEIADKRRAATKRKIDLETHDIKARHSALSSNYPAVHELNHSYPEGIQYMIPDAETDATQSGDKQDPVATAAPAIPVNEKRGRPPAKWWDDMWVAIAIQLYTGDLQPKKQADIEKAMLDWVASRGESAAPDTIRVRARKLWNAFQLENEK